MTDPVVVRIRPAPGSKEQGAGFLLALRSSEGRSGRIGVLTATHVLSTTDVGPIGGTPACVVELAFWDLFWRLRFHPLTVTRVLATSPAAAPPGEKLAEPAGLEGGADDWTLLELAESAETIAKVLGVARLPVARVRSARISDTNTRAVVAGFPSGNAPQRDAGLIRDIHAADQKTPPRKSIELVGSAAAFAPGGFSGAPLFLENGDVIGVVRVGSRVEAGNTYKAAHLSQILADPAARKEIEVGAVEGHGSGGELLPTQGDTARPGDRVHSLIRSAGYPALSLLVFFFAAMLIVAGPVEEAYRSSRSVLLNRWVLAGFGSLLLAVGASTLHQRLRTVTRYATPLTLAASLVVATTACGLLLSRVALVKDRTGGTLGFTDGYAFRPLAEAVPDGLCELDTSLPSMNANGGDATCPSPCARVPGKEPAPTWLSARIVWRSKDVGCQCNQTKLGGNVAEPCAWIVRKSSTRAIAAAASWAENASCSGVEVCDEEVTFRSAEDLVSWSSVRTECVTATAKAACARLRPVDRRPELPAGVVASDAWTKIASFGPCVTVGRLPKVLHGATIGEGGLVHRIEPLEPGLAFHLACRREMLTLERVPPTERFEAPAWPELRSITIPTASGHARVEAEGAGSLSGRAYAQIRVELCDPAASLACGDVENDWSRPQARGDAWVAAELIAPGQDVRCRAEGQAVVLAPTRDGFKQACASPPVDCNLCNVAGYPRAGAYRVSNCQPAPPGLSTCGCTACQACTCN